MSTRLLNILGLTAVIAIMATGFIIEYTEGFEPCPLCTLQRICFTILGCLFFLGIFMYRIRIMHLIVAFLATIVSTIGVILAGRQIWLQTLPPTGDCGMSFRYMLENFPLHQMISNIFQGSADCAERGWELLSLDLAQWSFVSFTGLLLLSLYLWTRRS